MTSPAAPIAARPAVARPRPSAGKRFLVTAVTVVVLAGLGYAAYRYLPDLVATPAAAGGGRGGHDFGGKGRPLPVVVAKARQGDFPVYLDALGNVTALNTVTVRPRVDGEVTKVLYSEGQLVQEGDLLAEIDPRPYQATLEQAQGQLAKDQAQLRNAQADVDRYNAAKETVSQQQIDTAAANYAQYEGSIKVDQGVISSANLNVSFCRITAPISGKIGLRAVDEGNIVHASDATGLATITQLDPIAVVFNLPEVNLPAVLAAQHATQKLTADILNADRSQLLASGELRAIDNQIDATTATVRIKAQFPNPTGMLFPNQFVNVRLKVRTIQNAVLVPTGATQRSTDGMFVYVVKPDDTVELRTVKVGLSEGAVTVIESGLAAGETVVTEGVDKLTAGMAVKAHDPSTRPAGDAASQPAGEHNRGGQGGGRRRSNAA